MSPPDPPPPPPARPPGRPDATIDPVRARRRQIERWSLLANRVGYLLLALAMACFIMAFVLGFSSTLITIVTVCLITGCILLAPSIVLGYAVKAAEREDRERGL